MINKSELKKLALALLDDDEGICLNGFNALHDLLQKEGLQEITDRVDATDGRFYLKE